jgi:hypothetical protein
MKPILIVSLTAAGLLLGGCETTVVERDNRYHGHGYRGDSSVVVVGSDRGRYNGYDRDYDNRYRGGYQARNVERTNVHINETNVNRTVVNRNVNRTNVNRTNVNVQKAPHGNYVKPVPQAQVQKKGGNKHKGNGHNDNESH